MPLTNSVFRHDFLFNWMLVTVQHEHPYTGTLAVEFDRSNPNGQHSKASRMAVISREDAADRLILNRAGRTSKTLESRSMIGQKKLRRRPLYMSNMAWRQRLAAMTPLNVVVGGNLHNLRAQVRMIVAVCVGLHRRLGCSRHLRTLP